MLQNDIGRLSCCTATFMSTPAPDARRRNSASCATCSRAGQPNGRRAATANS